MGIYKRGKTYWYKFVWRGELIRNTTRQNNQAIARQMEAAHRVALAKGDAGLETRKPTPTLRSFAEGEFLPFVVVQFAKKPKTLEYYKNGVARLLDFEPLAKLKLDEITSQAVTFYAQHRRRKLKVSSVNRELEVLRRMFRLATDWRKTERPLARVTMIRGEEHRERVLSDDEEAKYLAAAPTLLRDVVTILIECGLRPEEAFRLECSLFRDGRIIVPFGKTSNARREIALDPESRSLEILSRRRAEAEEANGIWLFPAATASGHIEKSSLRKQHARACKLSGVQPFVLYTLRHTCLTRLAEDMDPFTLMYIAGHESMETTKKYVHPQPETVQRAMRRVAGRHKSRHTVVSIESLQKKMKGGK